MLDNETIITQGKDCCVTESMEIPVTKFIPLASRLIGKLVKDPNREKTSKGGIILANDVEDPYVECQIIAVGRGSITHQGLVPNECKVGDMALLFNGKKYMLNDNGETYIIFNEADIVATYKPDAQTAEDNK